MNSRRRVLKRLACVALAGTALVGVPARNQGSRPTFNVRDFGARADSATVDADAIQRTLDAARQQSGADVLFPAGEYWLGNIAADALLTLSNAEDLNLVGEGATLRCRTTSGIAQILLVAGCRKLAISGLRFIDDGLNRQITWQGAVAIHISGDGGVDSSLVTVANCTFDSVLSALTVGGGTGRVRGITLSNLDVRGAYYGLNFQNNGDNVIGRDLRFSDVRRSYFPYGVDDHDIAFTSERNRTGSTDILIKCYSLPTTNIVVNATSRGKRQGDAIVAFEQQHQTGQGLISGVKVNLQVSDAQCALRSIFLFVSGAPDGSVQDRTTCVWRDITLDGQSMFCEAATKFIELKSSPEQVATVTLGPGIEDRFIPSDANSAFRFVRGS